LTAGLVALTVGFVPIHAAGPTAEIQREARAATFEFVVPKGSETGVSYATPLPLELVPFQERRDQYWSIGSAFALGPNRFVTAGHLFAAAVGRPSGRPGIRDSRGRVHSVDRVLGYSMAEDFAVFAVEDPPDDLHVLATSSSVRVDDAVLAVGNALGEGVVIRDGLLNSRTPEAREGRWDWLRFSAAASPGNSGGPLLDMQGRVIGVVTAKSPGENLNYALPIERVLEGSEESAILEQRSPFGLIVLRDPTLVDFRADFPLPADFGEFSRRFLQASRDYYVMAESRLLTESAAHLFPKGDAAEFFAEQYTRLDPALLVQQSDRRWGLLDTSGDAEQVLADNGRVWNTTDPRLTLFRLQFPEGVTDDRSDQGSTAFMDLLLKGLRLQRIVGPQAVQITSLGAATATETVVDRHRRVWRLQSWTMGFSDTQVLVLSTATPDGRVGMALQANPIGAELTRLQLRRLADFFFVSYTGTMRQWQAFLERRDERGGIFDSVRVARERSGDFGFESPLFRFTLPAQILQVDDHSRMDLWMSFVTTADGAAWLPVGVDLSDDDLPTTVLKIMRQARPAGNVPRAATDRWEQMSAGREGYAGNLRHDTERGEFWFRSVARPIGGAAAALYEVNYSVRELMMPRALESRRDEVMRRIVVTEPS
jgi:hypothetical protein